MQKSEADIPFPLQFVNFFIIKKDVCQQEEYTNYSGYPDRLP